jgi:hypothetical protein
MEFSKDILIKYYQSIADTGVFDVLEVDRRVSDITYDGTIPAYLSSPRGGTGVVIHFTCGRKWDSWFNTDEVKKFVNKKRTIKWNLIRLPPEFGGLPTKHTTR